MDWQVAAMLLAWSTLSHDQQLLHGSNEESARGAAGAGQRTGLSGLLSMNQNADAEAAAARLARQAVDAPGTQVGLRKAVPSSMLCMSICLCYAQPNNHMTSLAMTLTSTLLSNTRHRSECCDIIIKHLLKNNKNLHNTTHAAV